MIEPLAKLWLVPQDTREQLMAFDAIASNRRHFTVGHGLGRIDPGGPVLSSIAQMVLERICKHGDVAGHRLWLIEIAHVKRVKTVLTKVFTDASDGDVIMLMCRTPEIIDAMLPFLVMQSPGTA